MPSPQHPTMVPQKPLVLPTLIPGPSHLLLVIGGIRKHRGHVKHDLVVLVRGVEGVCTRGIRCGQGVENRERNLGGLNLSSLPAVWGLCATLTPPPQQVDNPFMPLANVQATSSSALAVPLPMLPRLQPPAWAQDQGC